MEIFVRVCRAIGRIGLILGLPIFVAAFCYLMMREYFFTAIEPDNTETVIYEIAPGTPSRQIFEGLEKEKLLKHWRSIDIIARIKGTDTKINAGEYVLSPSMTPREILGKLVRGDVLKRVVVFREGQSIWDLGELLEEAGIISAQEFNRALTNLDLLTRAGVAGKSFEGYLWPDTYNFSRPIDAERIIWKMLEEGERQWSEIYSSPGEKPEMTRHELLTLASIIEKESGNVAEQPLISSVFHNRLKRGMKLQSDPTVVYGIPDFKGVITKRHLETPTPYNTYTNFGLPPGPICNPGETAIRAALFPTPNSQYLFFVADGKGGHVFTTTLDEHNDAVQQYRRQLREQSGLTN